jgi:hypothetical protein
MKAYDELIDFIAAGHSSEQLASFEPSAQTRQRAWELVRKEKEAGLTDEERHELEVFGQLEHFMRLIKARARHHAQAA